MSENIQNAKNFVALQRSAVLSTLSRAHESFPFGSVVPYDVDGESRIVIFISLIAEHCKNLRADGRASIFVFDPAGARDPQPYSRATVLARFEEIPEEERSIVSERYFARFPESPGRSLVHDFVFFRGAPERVRWIGGFGDIRWIDGEKFRAAPADPVAYLGRPMIDHMNSDHLDALGKILEARGHSTAGKTVEMITIDSAGFRAVIRGSGKESFADVPFEKPVAAPEEVRRAIIALIPGSR